VSDPIKWFSQNPTKSPEDALVVFPNADLWVLRQARRDALRNVGTQTDDPKKVSQVIGADLTPTARAIVRSGALRPITVSVESAGRPLKPTLKRGEKTTLIVSDLHAGKDSHDPHALDLVIQVGQAAGVDEVIWNGDMYDCHSMSSYTPNADKPIRWAEERAMAIVPITHLYQAFVQRPQRFHYGNHCVRPNKWISKHAPQLQGLFDLETLLGLDNFDFTYPEDNCTVVGGNVLVKHGIKVSRNAGYSVTGEVADHGMSVIMGHVHRKAYTSVYKTQQRLNGASHLFGIEGGCLCNLRADYLEAEQTANWQHGSVILTEYSGIEMPVPEFIEIHGRHAFFRGQMFTSRVL
jgi:hypothetical protein